ncbi:hypothetical protein QS257_07780 [Terrilactibacillus sp. S3-3]|nr:hypothetical protein QS257_07780 [Terrilactibacillus sp. S3-3]
MRRHLALPVLVGVLLVFPLVLSACGSNPTSGAVSLDNVHYVKKEADLNKENQVSKTVEKELYLLDENGQVSPQVVKLPDSKSLAKKKRWSTLLKTDRYRIYCQMVSALCCRPAQL